MKAGPVLFLAAPAAALALVIGGCSGGGDSSGGGDPATLAPVDAPVYVEATVRPEGSLAKNVESLTADVAGITDPGGLIVGMLESEAESSGEELDFEKEIEPWLGEKAGLFLQEYDGEDFQGYGIAIESTDAGATQDFVDKHGKEDRDGTYEGIDFKVSDDETVVGVVGGFLAIAEDKKSFEAMVDSFDGESLADLDSYTSAVDNVPDGSLADVFVDVGGLIEEAGGSVDPEAKQFLESAGIEPKEATAVAGLIPGSDQVEIDVSTNVAGESAPAGDASNLLASMPGGSFAALASAEFGKRFGEAIDSIDKNGVPGQIPPNELKKTMSAAGIDLEKISASVGDVAVFAVGNSKSNLTGAVVMETTSSKEATNTVSNIGLLLRASGTPGVTAISGKATGFSIRDPEPGRQPLVVAAKGNRIAISYGLAASAQALTAGGGSTLASNPEYKEAVAALEGTPISGFVNGPAAVALAKNLIPSDQLAEFEEARPYLDKVGYVAIGAGSSGDEATAKLIVGLAK
ncbi:MAG TPA: DUF3352 domain-containing protein [Solirubrobacterales bacterium]|jgi:hypothetical protein